MVINFGTRWQTKAARRLSLSACYCSVADAKCGGGKTPSVCVCARVRARLTTSSARLRGEDGHFGTRPRGQSANCFCVFVLGRHTSRCARVSVRTRARARPLVLV